MGNHVLGKWLLQGESYFYFLDGAKLASNSEAATITGTTLYVICSSGRLSNTATP